MKTFFLSFILLLSIQLFAQNNCNTKSIVNVVTCEAYISPSGHQTFNSTGKYTDIITNTAGCDSLIEINLTVNEPIEVNCTHLSELDNHCYRVVFTINGGNPTGVGGTYLLSGDYEGLIAPKESITSHCIDIEEVFKVQIEDGSGCKTSFTDGYPGQLPVFLISFTVEEEPNGNLLKWITGNEIDNDYFYVERSINGIDFDKIAQIRGAGTTSVTQSYTYLDVFDQTGLAYYKLFSKDFDGTVTQFGIVGSERYEPSFNIAIIFPNPVVSFLQFSLQTVFDVQDVETDYPGRIQIYNALQQVVFDDDHTFNFGLNVFKVNVHDFPEGVYTLVISSNDQVIAEQFVKGY